jgi:folate-binding protein YgfZ
MAVTLEKIFGGREPMGNYGGASTPAHFGSVRAEYDALRKDAAVFDLSWRAKLSLAGDDRVRWLNGMITNNVRDLAPGHGVYAFLLNPQGRILGDLYAYNLGDSIVVDTDRSQYEKIRATFDHYIIMDDVEIADKPLSAFGVGGPRAPDALQRAGFNTSALQPLEITSIEWRGDAMRLVRTGSDPFPAFEIWFAPEAAAPLWGVLVEAQAHPAGSEALELFRIARGIPRYGQDIRERDLPQETEQQRALNFNKGCYVGQEIVERIRSRGSVHRAFTGFRVDGPALQVGTKIDAEGKEIGEITSSATLPAPEGERAVALGYIRREILALKKELQAGGTRIAPSELPFMDLLSA